MTACASPEMCLRLPRGGGSPARSPPPPPLRSPLVTSIYNMPIVLMHK